MRGALRATAVIIALAAAADPSVTSSRRGKPEVSLITGSRASDSSLAARVARALDDRFTVVRGPLAGADAGVFVGAALPSRELREAATTTFAVLPDRGAASMSIESVRAPASAPYESRIPVTATVRVTGARDRTLDVTLGAKGLAADRATRTVAGDDERFVIPLSYLPSTAGAAPLRVTASMNGAESSSADVAVDVRDARWQVLVFDPRPSWMSTFVQRALERDRRFVVTSRVETSRNVSSTSGSAPRTLSDLASLWRFDAIVIGAPHALSDADVAGLEAFLRKRGGGVALLLDTAAVDARLTGVSRWQTSTTGRVARIADADTNTLRAGELAWPAVLPPVAEPLAFDSAAQHPVVWRAPLGAGELLVSGALDAWRFRDPLVSGFDRFWQTRVAELASGALAPLNVTLDTQIASPGEVVDAAITIRDVALAGRGASHISATLGDQPVELFPGNAVGEVRATLHAPRTPGVYRFSTNANGHAASVPLIVSAAPVTRATPDDDRLLTAWAASHGGRAVPERALDSLPSLLDAVLHPVPRLVTWHPMRSMWWMALFALALGAEWWLRRRRGLA